MKNEEAIALMKNLVHSLDNNYYGLNERGQTAFRMAIMALEERKKGKWEIYVISMLDGEGCRCSECGFEGAPYWDYCPNCGADMREESEDEMC